MARWPTIGDVDIRPPAAAIDAVAAAWIAPRLLDNFGAVCRTIPTGFSAYARILHPADPGAARPRRWAEVAAATGRTIHPQAQFARIATPAPHRPHDTTLPEIQPPATGDLAPEQLTALCQILRRHTSERVACWFAVWDGWGELNGSVFTASAAFGGPPPPSPSPAPEHSQLDLRAAQFDLPGRRYYLFTGVLDDALRIGYWPTRTWFQPRSPNLFWPDDRSWCVTSEIDFDSTLVAGSTELIDNILRSDDLEAWPVRPYDSLAAGGDIMNLP